MRAWGLAPAGTSATALGFSVPPGAGRAPMSGREESQASKIMTDNEFPFKSEKC